MRFTFIVALALAGLPAFGQKFEVGPYFTYNLMTRKPLGTVRQLGGAENDTQFRNGIGFGLRATYNTKGYYGHEVSYVRSQVPLKANVDEFLIDPATGFITLGGPADRQEKLRVTRLSYNFLMYMMPKGEKWRPYISFGAVSQKFNPPRFIEWTEAGGRNFGFNYGAGIKLMPINHWLVRLDFRHMLIGRPFPGLMHPSGITPGGNMGQMEVSAGFSYAFGK